MTRGRSLWGAAPAPRPAHSQQPLQRSSPRRGSLLCLLHAASSAELRTLTTGQADLGGGTVRLARRPGPVPLDPLSLEALRDCLAWREHLGTRDQHLLITRRNPAAPAPVLDRLPPSASLAGAGVTPHLLRQTRIAGLAHRADPKIVASALGVHRETPLHYLIGDLTADDLTSAQTPPDLL